MKKVALLIVILLFNVRVKSQSLLDQMKVDQLNDKAKSLMRVPDSLKFYSAQANNLAQSINYKSGEATALKFLGIYYHSTSDYDEAINNYNNSLTLFKELKNDLEIGKIYLNIATSYNAKLDYPKVSTYGLESLKYFKKINDQNGEARVLNLLGIISSAQKNYPEALKFFKEYNKLALKVNDKREIGSSYNNIGSTFERLDKLDSSIYYYKKALPITLENGSQSNIGKLYQNIGGLYNAKNDGKNALKYHLMSKSSYEKMEDEKFLSHSYFNIGLSHKQLKDTLTAKIWFNKAIVLATQLKETEILKESFEQLSKLESSKNNFKEAFENLKLSNSYKDSILDIEKNKFVENLKTKYETEKKEEQIKDLSQKATIKDLEIKQKNSILFFSLMLFIVFAFGVWLFINRRQIKNRIAMQDEIMKQQDIATRSILEAEEKERRRIAGDLHDGVGQLLSVSLLNFNNFYNNLKGRLNPDENINGDKVLGLINESYDEVRSISHQMMPNALLKAGLTTAVREFISKIDAEKLKINLGISGINERLDAQTETVLYRVIQESANNVIKHAKASLLSIQLVKDKEGINLSIEDNGVGFDKNSTKNGIGLENIKSRIALINGEIEYDTAIGKGTLVNIFIPA
jgi:signal transduction histidine kinase